MILSRNACKLTAASLATLALSAFLFAANTAQAKGLDVDLSKPDVRLDVSFKGSELLLFGSRDNQGDVIVVVRGPEKETPVRFKERIAGIWVSGNEVIFENVPSYYALASSRPVGELLPQAVLEQEEIGLDQLEMSIKSAPSTLTPAKLIGFKDGLLRNMIDENLYSGKPGQVELVGNSLFRTDLWFPANVHVGEYVVDTYLIENGQIAEKNSTQLSVHKVGIEAEVFTFARENALLYGLLAILIAGVAGWIANAVFKKRG